MREPVTEEAAIAAEIARIRSLPSERFGGAGRQSSAASRLLL
jgi:hypothetical protein